MRDSVRDFFLSNMGLLCEGKLGMDDDMPGIMFVVWDWGRVAR